ncbi:MAG: type II secretion system protein [Phycisphaerae bacterium]
MNERNQSRIGRGKSCLSPGFTLIELLVVVAIIALLISILLPSLNAARSSAKATKCGTNLASVGKAVHGYLAENKAVFPLAYVWASDRNGGEDISRQDRVNGYIHWSYRLFQKGQVKDESFQCPDFDKGGHPRTNPGPNAGLWVEDQIGGEASGGGSRPNPDPGSPATYLEDKQAPWMAYTVNSAVMAWNRLGNVQVANPKFKFVKESDVDNGGRVILAAEFNTNFKVVSRQIGGDGLESIAHRPVRPFSVAGLGYDEFQATPNSTVPQYSYHPPGGPDKDYGLLPLSRLEEQSNVLEGTVRSLNAVGRHHPGGDRLGGSGNFLFVDGHVARTTILKTLQDRQWGTKYYSMSGTNNGIPSLDYATIP